MDVYKNEKTKYDVPLDHLDYGYVEQCNDIKELEKILKILRSGTEGTFPDLEGATEKKIRHINPQSRILVKDQPIFTTKEMGNEGKDLASDFAQWTDEIHTIDRSIKEAGLGDALPPIRGQANISLGSQGSVSQNAEKTSNRKPMPRSHKEWDKVDIEAELKKLDDDSNEPKQEVKNVVRNPNKPNIAQRIDATGLTDDEKRIKAEKEKDKGNEAFRAGDYEEALVYYNRSISLVPSVPSVNNRAQAYVKLEKWNEAITDCETVLKQDPENLKAHLRRSVAFKSKKQFKDAKSDLDWILSKEPTNKRAKALLEEVEEFLAEQQVKGRRMVIEEVSDDEEESDHEPEVTQPEVKQPEAASPDQQNNAETQKPKEQPKTIKETDSSKMEQIGDSQKQLIKSPELTRDAELNEESINDDGVDEKGDKMAAEKQDGGHETTESVKAPEPEVVYKPPPPLSPELNALKEAGNTLFRAGSYADAIHKYDVIVQRLENDDSQGYNLSQVYSNRAACKTKIGDCSGCVEDCSRALVLTPHTLKPLMRRAMAYETLEKYRAAYVDYRHILSIDTSVEIAKTGSSRCQQALAQMDGPKWRDKLPQIPVVDRSNLPPPSAPTQTSTPAASAARKQQQPTVEELFEKSKNEGNDLVKKGSFELAVVCYSKCIDLCPDKTAPYTNRALCYLRLNKPNEVLSDCNKVLQSEPSNVKALFRRGQAYKMLRNFEASKRDLDVVLGIESKNTAARRELGLVTKYIEEEKAKKREEEALAAKGRRKLQIQEVDDSSDESGDDVTSDTPVVNNVTSGISESTDNQNKNKQPKDIKKEVPEKSTKSTSGEAKARKQESKQNKKATEKSSKSNGDGSGAKPVAVAGVKTGTQGMGVTYDMKVTKASSKIRPTVQSTQAADGKSTPYEFMSSWIALKNTEQIEPYLAILKQVKPVDLPKVISNKLESDMLQKIIQCAHKMAATGDVTQSYDYLKCLTKVPRFQMNTMFMSASEKEVIQNLLNKFSPTVSSKDVGDLRKQYGIK